MEQDKITVCLHLRAFGCEQCKAVLRRYDELLREIYEAAVGDWNAWVSDPNKTADWCEKVEKLYTE